MLKQAIEGRIISVTATHYITETSRGKQSWHKDYYRVCTDDLFLSGIELQKAHKTGEPGEIISIKSFILSKVKKVVGFKQEPLGSKRKLLPVKQRTKPNQGGPV